MTKASNTTAHNVSVVICAYTEQRWNEIIAAINSAHNQSMMPHEIVLVVDYCNDLFERAKHAFGHLRDVQVVPNISAKGLSGARNTGFRSCSGDVVAFLDDDAIAATDWLECLLPAFDDPKVVGAGGRVIPRWETSRPSWFPPEFDWVIGCSHAGMPSSAENVRNLIGANMAFRREVLIAVNGFSTALGRLGTNTAGCEETELCIRAAVSIGGACLMYEPRACVMHFVPRTRGTWRYFFHRCFNEGLSKAVVVSLTDRQNGLSSERAYLRSTIPRAIARGLTRSTEGASLRAIATIAGTAMTVGGYLKGKVGTRQSAVLR